MECPHARCDAGAGASPIRRFPTDPLAPPDLWRPARALALALAVAMAPACGDSRSRTEDAGVGMDMAGGQDVAPKPDAPASVGCPNVVIVQDFSQSMCVPPEAPWGSTCCDYPPPPECYPKWDIAKDVVGKTTLKYEEKIRFGLVICPAPRSGCAPCEMSVDPDYGTAAKITETYIDVHKDNTWGGGNPLEETYDPTFTSARSLSGSVLLKDSARASYTLLITDGVPGCKSYEPAALQATTKATLAHLETLATRDPFPVKTYVMGFGRDDTGVVDPCVLGKMAIAGGTAREGCDAPPAGDCDIENPGAAPARPCYYDAADAAALEAAMENIVAGLVATAGTNCMK